MDSFIEEIFLSSEDKNIRKLGSSQITDVVVLLKNKKQYVSSFFSYEKIKGLELENRNSNKFLNGKYFWSKDMILISKCDRETIEQVIYDLFEEGSFFEAFRDINNSSN